MVSAPVSVSVPTVIVHSAAVVQLREFASREVAKLVESLSVHNSGQVWSLDLFCHRVLPHVSWLFDDIDTDASLRALSPASFRDSALGVQSSVSHLLHSDSCSDADFKVLLNDMRCEALNQLVGSLRSLYRKIPLISISAKKATLEYVSICPLHADLVRKLQVGCNVILPLLQSC